MSQIIWDVMSKKKDIEVRTLELALSRTRNRCLTLKDKITSVDSYIQEYSDILMPVNGKSISIDQQRNTIAFIGQLVDATEKLCGAYAEFSLKSEAIRAEILGVHMQGMKYRKIAELQSNEARIELEAQERKLDDELFLAKFASRKHTL